jgi:chemotaxis protein CheD
VHGTYEPGVLPGKRGPVSVMRSGDPKLDGRYSDGAMALFLREANRRGTDLKEYQAKIFGGSNMLASSTLREDELIGTKNTEAALKHLTERGIPLLVAHVGETGHRRIAFDVETGDVWVKHEPLQKIIP